GPPVHPRPRRDGARPAARRAIGLVPGAGRCGRRRHRPDPGRGRRRGARRSRRSLTRLALTGTSRPNGPVPRDPIAPIDDVMTERRTDEAALLARIQRLLEEHPGAKVIAFDPDTLDDRLEVPRLFGVPPEQIVTGPEILASARPEDQPVLLAHVLQVV